MFTRAAGSPPLIQKFLAPAPAIQNCLGSSCTALPRAGTRISNYFDMNDNIVDSSTQKMHHCVLIQTLAIFETVPIMTLKIFSLWCGASWALLGDRKPWFNLSSKSTLTPVSWVWSPREKSTWSEFSRRSGEHFERRVSNGNILFWGVNNECAKQTFWFDVNFCVFLLFHVEWKRHAKVSRSPGDLLYFCEHLKNQRHVFMFDLLSLQPSEIIDLDPDEGGSAKVNRTCIRDGCLNPAISDPQWNGEYCSSECVINHCRWVATTRSSRWENQVTLATGPQPGGNWEIDPHKFRKRV